MCSKIKKDDTHKELDRPGIHAKREDTHVLRLTNKLVDLRTGYVYRHPATPKACRTEFKSKAYTSKGKKKQESTKDSCFSLEVQAGFEPADNGVADRGLTTWLLHQISNYPNIIAKIFGFVKGERKKIFKEIIKNEKVCNK